MPVISPPTPPQLTQDKTEISASFDRAFALIDQLSTDTGALKAAEAERNEKLDAALKDIEAVTEELRQSNQRRKEEGKRMADEVAELKAMIPKALDGWKSEGDGKLKEIGAEMKSLKVLLGNRLGNQSQSGPGPSGTSPARASTGYGQPNGYGMNVSGSNQSTVAASTPSALASGAASAAEDSPGGSAPAPGINVPKGSVSSFASGARPNRATIPAWQMAAANKSKAEEAAANSGTAETGAGAS